MFERIKTIFEIVSTVVVTVAAGMLGWRLYQAPAGPPAARPTVENVAGLSISSDKMTKARGTGTAVLVEFGDYECPFCARHAQQTAPTIKKDLIDSGKVQQVFLNFPLPMHPHAEKAGEAAECAGRQGRFWEMHEELFANPQALAMPDLLSRAQHIGLNMQTFSACLEDAGTAVKVKADQQEGRRLGVDATPAFFVGARRPDGSITILSRINGAASYETFKQAIEAVTSN